MKTVRFLLAVLCLLMFSIPVYASGSLPIFTSAGHSTVYFNGHEKNRLYQGVATDGTYIYATTDQDVNFKNDNGNVTWDNNNIISVYDMQGNFIREKKNVYEKLSVLGNFMSFGDINYIDGYLYAVVYDRVPPNESRVIKFNRALNVVAEYPVGDNEAESIDKHDGYFFVTNHHNNEVYQFDEEFNLVEKHVMSESPPVNAGYQGIYWDGNDMYVNLHASTVNGVTYAGGLDRYTWNGTDFIFKERIKPPTAGSCQGVELFGDRVYWLDRFENRIIITPKPIKSNLKVTDRPTEKSFYHPTLLNDWTTFKDREVSIWKDPFGVVHIEGMITGGKLTNGAGQMLEAFVLPKEYWPINTKNMPIVSNSKFGSVNITPDGRMFIPVGDSAWVSFDGITFMTLDAA